MAIAYYKKAIELDPKSAMAHYNLGLALRDNGNLEGAITAYQKAIELDPGFVQAHHNLGLALRKKGDLPGAIAACQKAIELDPKLVEPRLDLGNVLRAKGDLAGAIAAYQKAVELDPKHVAAHNDLGLALRATGDLAGAIAAYQKAIELDPKHVAAHYNLGFALHAKGDLPDAIAAYQKAIELNGNHARAHNNLGHALRLQGKFAESLATYRRAHELGSKLRGFRDPSGQWVHEAERLVELDHKLPAILSGQEQPADAPERAEYARVCGYKRLYVGGVRLYREAFAGQPALADDMRTGHRYNAACLAARAGTGQGEDARSLKEPQRLDLRKRALDWLRAELLAWTKLVDGGKPNDRALARQTLQHWQRDRDLAALRGEADLAKLPSVEREAWHKLWTEVATVLQQAGEEKN